MGAALDAVRLGPDDDERAVTAAQLREVVTRLIARPAAGDGDPPVLVTMDAHYSPVQLAWLLRDLPVTIVARVRSNRVCPPAAARAPGTRGRPARRPCAAPTRLLISPANRSFRYGDGFFETMKYAKGQLVLQQLHFERLFASLDALYFKKPFFLNPDFLVNTINLLIAKNKHKGNVRIRMNIFREWRFV